MDKSKQSSTLYSHAVYRSSIKKCVFYCVVIIYSHVYSFTLEELDKAYVLKIK